MNNALKLSLLLVVTQSWFIVFDQDIAVAKPHEIEEKHRADALPNGNPGEWVTPADYPEWALLNDVEGRVGFTLEIDESGSIVSCQVTETSGTPDLDKTSCDKIIERGTFKAATNSLGEPVPGKWSSAVRWVIPKNRIIPIPPPEFWTATYVVETDGSVSSCEMEKAEGGAEYYDFCAELPRFLPSVGEEGQAERKKIKVLHRLIHEDVPQ